MYLVRLSDKNVMGCWPLSPTVLSRRLMKHSEVEVPRAECVWRYRSTIDGGGWAAIASTRERAKLFVVEGEA